MKTVLVLGCTGLLGRVVADYFSEETDHDVIVTNRQMYDATENIDKIASLIEASDYVINCIGIINKHVDKDVPTAIRVNGEFPWELSALCKELGTKLIHITTDCVFSGKNGDYREHSHHDCEDMYGKSKSIGEPDNCMVIRTSIIGPEPESSFSFVGWLCSMEGSEVNGFTNHLWNGITTRTYAQICNKIIEQELYEEGLFHVFSPEWLTKYQLARMVNKKYNLGITIHKHKADRSVNRTLSSSKSLCGELEVPSLRNQIDSM
jgi:dTDP-4-dehydrorhamnose reductase